MSGPRKEGSLEQALDLLERRRVCGLEATLRSLRRQFAYRIGAMSAAASGRMNPDAESMGKIFARLDEMAQHALDPASYALDPTDREEAREILEENRRLRLELQALREAKEPS